MYRTRAEETLYEIHWGEDDALWIGCLYQWRRSCQLLPIWRLCFSSCACVFAFVHLFRLQCLCLFAGVTIKVRLHALLSKNSVNSQFIPPDNNCSSSKDYNNKNQQQKIIVYYISRQILAENNVTKQMIKKTQEWLHRKREALTEVDFER